MNTIEAILYATDFSDPAQSDFRFGCLLARTLQARLLVIHVCPPPICHGEEVARRQENGFHECLWKDLEKIQPPDPDIRVEHMLKEGEESAQIVRVADEILAD
jgi:nucleotide-binding universal stress UspA family protein